MKLIIVNIFKDLIILVSKLIKIFIFIDNVTDVIIVSFIKGYKRDY